ncbi:adhesion G-protein coupled receptor G4 isoform X2 [Hydra vulgaris]|uniref:adhesion G-protein coupled receptor G4 isoform X2 n=1 Tax=Hydra vulgaris TaxID=6087 RepID=UPI0032EA0D79
MELLLQAFEEKSLYVSAGNASCVMFCNPFFQCLQSCEDHTDSQVLLNEVRSNLSQNDFNYLQKYGALGFISAFDATQINFGSYCQRVRGWFQAETLGNYTFFISCSSNCQLYLSSNIDSEKKIQIAYQVNSSGYTDWNKYPQQKSIPKYIQANWRYYIEGKMCNLSPAYISVAVQKEGNNTLPLSSLSSDWFSPMRIGLCPSGCNSMANEKCILENGTYAICTCENGYVYYYGNNVTCIKSTDCKMNCTISTCRGSNGKLQRYCPVGFFFNTSFGGCQDINECLINCKYDRSICKNLIGSFNCSCPKGAVFNSSTRDCEVISCAKGVLTIDLDWTNLYSNNLSEVYINLAESLKVQVQSSFTLLSMKNVVVEVQGFYKSNLDTVALIDVYFSNIPVSNQLKNCQLMKNMSFGLVPLKIINAVLRPCDCCVEDTVGTLNFTGIYTFPITLVKMNSIQTVSISCLYNTSIIFNRQCIRGGLATSPYWSTANLANCPPKFKTSNDLIKLQLETITASNVEQITNNLKTILENGTITNEYDINIVYNIVKKVVNSNLLSEMVTNNVLSSVDILLNTSPDLIDVTDKYFNFSTQILYTLETLGALQTKNITISKTSLAFTSFIPQNPESLFIYANFNGDNLNLSIKKEDQRSISENLQAYIFLPAQIFKGNSGNVYSYAFKKKTFFKESETTNYFVDSLILSATANGLKVENATTLIGVGFNSIVSVSKRCGFWKPEISKWSSDGCHTVASNLKDFVQCECNHLTNFALILDIEQSGYNPLELQIVTWIGCVISIICLFITMIFHIANRKLRSQLAPKILVALSTNLMLTLILFLAFVEKTKPPAICKVVASLIQFFLLSTFCWMSVEAFNLYQMFVKVFRGSLSSYKFLLKSAAFAWGVPLIVTVTTGVVKPDALGPATKNKPQICVVQGVPFYFAVLLPVCIALLSNIIILVLVQKGIALSSKLTEGHSSKKNPGFTNVRIAFGFSILIGVTWLFAILAVGSFRNIFQWLFCIFNSLQGFFIFVFYTLRNSELKICCKKCWTFNIKSYLTSSSTQSIPNQSMTIFDQSSSNLDNTIHSL